MLVNYDKETEYILSRLIIIFFIKYAYKKIEKRLTANKPPNTWNTPKYDLFRDTIGHPLEKIPEAVEVVTCVYFAGTFLLITLSEFYKLLNTTIFLQTLQLIYLLTSRSYISYQSSKTMYKCTAKTTLNNIINLYFAFPIMVGLSLINNLYDDYSLINLFYKIKYDYDINEEDISIMSIIIMSAITLLTPLLSGRAYTQDLLITWLITYLIYYSL